MAQAKRLATRQFEHGKTALDLDGQLEVWLREQQSIRATHDALDSAINRVERRLTDWRNAIEGTCFDQLEHIEEVLWTDYDAFRAEHNVDEQTENWSDKVIDLDDQERSLFREINDAKSRIAYQLAQAPERAAAKDAADAVIQRVVTTARAEQQAIATLESLSGTTPPSYSQGSSQVPAGTPLPQGTPASRDDFTSTDAPITLEAPATSELVTSHTAPGHGAVDGHDLEETVTIDTDMSARTMFLTKKPGAGFRNIPVTGSPGPVSGPNAVLPTRKRVTIAADAAKHTTFGSVNDTIPAGAPRHSTPKAEAREFSFSPTNAIYADERTLNTIRKSVRVTAPSVHTFKGNSLKKFSCDPGEFSRFIRSFLLIVERQEPPLRDHQKLEFLAAHLDGAPKELVSNFDLTDEDYEEACNLLASRYSCTKSQKQSWLAKIRAVQPPDCSRADSLLHFFDSVMPLVIQLERHGVDLSGDSAYTEEVLKKIDSQFLTDKIIERADDPHNVSLREAMEWLRYAADTKKATIEAKGGAVPAVYNPDQRSDKRSSAMPGKPFRNQGFHKANRFEKPPDRYGHAFATNVADQREGAPSPKPKLRCRMCDEYGHFPTECPQYPTAKQRFDRANELGFCHACLRKEEWKGQCAAHHVKCRDCKRGWHHISLCEAREQRRKRGNTRDKDGRPYTRRPTPPPPRQNTDRPHQDQYRSNGGRTGRTYSTSVEEQRLPPYPDEEYCFSEPESECDRETFDGLYPEEIIPHECRDGVCRCGECYANGPAQDEPSSDEENEAHCHGGIIPNGTNGKREACLLECCRAVVSNPNGDKSVETTVFFDAGSTHSFVREELAKELDLPNMGRYDLGVHTFAGPEAVPLHGFKSRINIQTTDGSPISLICIRLIMSLLAWKRYSLGPRTCQSSAEPIVLLSLPPNYREFSSAEETTGSLTGLKPNGFQVDLRSCGPAWAPFSPGTEKSQGSTPLTKRQCPAMLRYLVPPVRTH